MSRAFSLYLDVLRLWAAVMVLLAHWAFPRFTGSDHMWMRHHDLGGDGVVIFFVLSGLLISYAAEKRRADGPRAFAADRLSRLWSVAIPALLACYAFDVLGQAAAPQLYAMIGYEGGVSWQAIVSGATFTNQLWFGSVQPGTNGPYWSLGYEAWYYLIFAAAFFAPPRWRWWLAGGAAMIAGPKIWLLAPSWILGVVVWRMIAAGRTARYGRALALTLALAPLVIYFLAHQAFLHVQLKDMTAAMLGDVWMTRIGFSDTFVWSALLGVLTSAHILGMASLCQSISVPKDLTSERAIRWLAGGSFALYLIHFPVMHFAAAILPGAVDAGWRQMLVLLVPVVVAYAFAEMSERRRPALRIWLRDKVSPQETPAPATAQPAATSS